MDNNIVCSTTNKEKLTFIVEETTREMNRVLDAWSRSKIKTKDDVMSLFRSYLAKFFKHKFGWQYYNGSLRQCDLIPIIDDNRLIGISMTDKPLYKKAIVEDLQSVIREFDFLKFASLNPVAEYKAADLLDDFKPSNLTLESINFDDIKNIKF